MTRKECLDILELPVGASRDEVVKAYRHLAQVWHPDRFPNNRELQQKAHVKLSKINEAYTTLIEGKATPDTNTESSGNERTNAAPNSAPNAPMPYRDDQVRYLGSDPRLKPLSQWPSPISSEGVPAIIEVIGEGVTLVTFNGQLADESICYSAASLWAVEEGTNRWLRRGIQNQGKPILDRVPSEEIRLVFSDPEGILNHSIVVTLRVRNTYFTQLLLKRLQAVADLEKWTPPRTTPQPTPEVRKSMGGDRHTWTPGGDRHTWTPPPTTPQPTPPDPVWPTPPSPTPPDSERIWLENARVQIAFAVVLTLGVLSIGVMASLPHTPSPPSTVQTILPSGRTHAEATAALSFASPRTPPTHAQTHGSFTVWTDTPQPAVGQSFVCTIAIRLPAGISQLPSGDLHGRLVGNDQARTSVLSLIGFGAFPVENRLVTVTCRVPESASFASNHLEIHSKSLGQSSTFVLRPIEDSKSNSTPSENPTPQPSLSQPSRPTPLPPQKLRAFWTIGSTSEEVSKIEGQEMKRDWNKGAVKHLRQIVYSKRNPNDFVEYDSESRVAAWCNPSGTLKPKLLVDGELIAKASTPSFRLTVGVSLADLLRQYGQPTIVRTSEVSNRMELKFMGTNEITIVDGKATQLTR